MIKIENSLKKYNISEVKEIFYILLNCIDSNISKYEDLVSLYKDRDDFNQLKQDYKKFYDYVHNYFEEIDINKEMLMHHKIIELVDFVLDSDYKELQRDLKVLISNVIDIIFIKYHLNITNFNTNEEIREYLLSQIKDERIVNILVMLLLADTTLTNKDLDDIPEEEFENIITNIILISLYICKGNK